MSGPVEATIQARMRHCQAALRISPGVWRKFHAEGPGGRHIELFVGRDKNRCDAAREKACKLLRGALEREFGKKLFVDRDAGMLTHQWEPVARVLVSPHDRPAIKWNRNGIVDMGLDFASVVEAGKRCFAPKQIEWCG